MKPLVLWCRWNDAKLRLHGRSESEVWGEIALPNKVEQFRFNLELAELRLGNETSYRRLKLDEMGVEVTSN